LQVKLDGTEPGSTWSASPVAPVGWKTVDGCLKGTAYLQPSLNLLDVFKWAAWRGSNGNVERGREGEGKKGERRIRKGRVSLAHRKKFLRAPMLQFITK